MELSIRKSKIHFLLIALCFTWGVTALWYADLIPTAKWVLSVLLLSALGFELRTWFCAPLSMSLRGEKLYLHYSTGSTKLFPCSNARAHLFWIGLGSKREGLAAFPRVAFLFQDSFSMPNWRALRRAICSARQN